jgi:hypothetical protein
MKIDLMELKKAVQWIEANSRDIQIRVEVDSNGRNLILKCEDRTQVQIEIKLFHEASMGAKIRKEESL